jgi:hypothetical protein
MAAYNSIVLNAYIQAQIVSELLDPVSKVPGFSTLNVRPSSAHVTRALPTVLPYRTVIQNRQSDDAEG